MQNIKGNRCPKCMDKVEGPLPVYKKIYFPFSTWSKITFKSQCEKNISLFKNGCKGV